MLMSLKCAQSFHFTIYIADRVHKYPSFTHLRFLFSCLCPVHLSWFPIRYPIHWFYLQVQPRGFQPIQAPAKLPQYGYSHGLSGKQAMRQPATISSRRPTSQSDKTSLKKLSPWEAASQSAVGSVEEAFHNRNIQESIAKNIVSAARRKTLPEPPEEWKTRVAYVPPVSSSYSSIAASQVRRPSSITSSIKASASIPASTFYESLMYKQPLSYPRSLTDSDLSAGAYSEHEISGKQVADPNYNPYPRGWKKQS
ncbi:synaptopodin-2-like [Mustelus asterias]